jgi:putative protease
MMVRETLAGDAGASLGAGQHRQLRRGALLAKLGVSRIILSRELSLDEVAEIRQECPDIELEVFVHGALCIAYSGRCLLSGYFNHRDPNQGSCTNSCRWDYKVQPARRRRRRRATRDAGNPKGRRRGRTAAAAPAAVWLLEEQERPGELMPIEEDEHGTYIMNSKDLRAIEHVQRLVEIGVDSLKIEGRTKSPYYVARTAQVYRRRSTTPSPAAPSTRACSANSKARQSRLHRRLLPAPPRTRNAELPARPLRIRPQPLRRRCHRLGRARGLAEVEVKNRFAVGDRIESHPPVGQPRNHAGAHGKRDATPISVAPGNGHRVWIPLPGTAGAMLARFV